MRRRELSGNCADRRSRRRRGRRAARRGARRRRPRLPRQSRPASHAARILAALSPIASGNVRVLATAVMKLESPLHRGTTWTCRCSLTLPPAAWPRLMPTLSPSGRYARFSAATASVDRRPQLGGLVGGELLEVGDLPVRQHHQVPRRVREGVHDDEARRAPVDDVGLGVVEAAVEDPREHAARHRPHRRRRSSDAARHVGGAPPVPQVVEDVAVHGWRSVRGTRARTADRAGLAPADERARLDYIGLTGRPAPGEPRRPTGIDKGSTIHRRSPIRFTEPSSSGRVTLRRRARRARRRRSPRRSGRRTRRHRRRVRRRRRAG